jgi:hypothetical protein
VICSFDVLLLLPAVAALHCCAALLRLHLCTALLYCCTASLVRVGGVDGRLGVDFKKEKKVKLIDFLFEFG